MALITRLKKNLSLKKQFFIFCVISIILSLIVSTILIITTILIFSPMKAVASIEEFAETNKEKLLNKDFKVEMDRNFQERMNKSSDSYWVILKDKSIIYSSISREIPKELNMEATKYSKKAAEDKNYRVIFKPITLNGELKGALVLKCKNRLIFNIKFINNLLEANNWELVFNFFILLPILLISPIIIILIFSILFAKSITNPLKEIILWSENIKNNNLNFEVDMSYNNEMGKVMRAFEEMRGTLESSLKAQWRMTKERKEMVLSLTHDIKTPITVICGHLELITGNYSNVNEEDKKKSLDVIMSNANRVKTLVNELNEVWDLEKPEFRLNRNNVNLVEFLDEIEDKFSYICSEKNINFSVSHPFNGEEYFNFDAFRIEEILENLISNSLRFTKESDSVKIECSKKDDNLMFKVSDSGQGFDEEDINKVFERFYKEPNTTTQKHNCGLGLYICKLIVQKHNGWIKAYNNSGAVVQFLIKDTHSSI